MVDVSHRAFHVLLATCIRALMSWMEFLATKKWEERKKPSDLGSRRDGMGFKYLTSEREKDKKPAALRRVACINESNRIELIAWASCLSFLCLLICLWLYLVAAWRSTTAVISQLLSTPT